MNMRLKKTYCVLAALIFVFAGLILLAVLYVKNNNQIRLYAVGRIANYDVYAVNGNYVVVTFSGSGNWLSGGIIHKDNFPYSENMQAVHITELLENKAVCLFSTRSYNEGDLCIGNYDFDDHIEIFCFEIGGTNLELPVEITETGLVRKQNMWENIITVPLIALNMFPIFILAVITLVSMGAFGILLIVGAYKK